jgi:hypothetical protein
MSAACVHRCVHGVVAIDDKRAIVGDRSKRIIITSVDRPSAPVTPSRAKPHEQTKSKLRQWRPMTSRDNRVDPW